MCSLSNPKLKLKESLLSGHNGHISAVRFNDDGEYCLSCGKDGTVCLWDSTTKKHIKTYNCGAGEVRDFAVSSDTSRLFCGVDRDLVLLDVLTGKIRCKISGLGGEVNAVKFREKENVTVSAGEDHLICCWDSRVANDKRPTSVLGKDDFEDSITSIFVKNEKLIAGSTDRSVGFFDLRSEKAIKLLKLKSPISCIVPFNKGGLILVGCLDSSIHAMDRNLGNGRHKKYLSRDYICKDQSTFFKRECCLYKDDSFIFSGSDDGSIVSWDQNKVLKVSNWKGHGSAVTCASYHPEQDKMVTSDASGQIKIWETVATNEKQVYQRDIEVTQSDHQKFKWKP